MAQTVTSENEVILNGVKYPLVGNISRQLLSRFPGKVSIGDNSYSNEQYLSNLIYSDQRGGIGVEEFSESVHAAKNWFSTCDTRFTNHIVLPPLATSVTLPTLPTLSNGSMEAWTGSVPTGWTDSSTNGTLSQESTIVHGGTYSLKVLCSGGGLKGEAYQDMANWSNDFRGATVCVSGYVYTDADDDTYIAIDDGIGETATLTTSDSAWTQFFAYRTLDAAATRIRVQLRVTSAGGEISYFDDIDYAVIGTPKKFITFNDVLYLASGKNLLKLNSGGTAFTLLYQFQSDITDITYSEGSSLYICLGDSAYYWYMSTAEAFTQTNSANAYYFIHWSGKGWKINSTGQLAYAADPSHATPSWTNDALLDTLVSGSIRGLELYRDADGAMIIYAVCENGVWAHDNTNTVWVETQVTYPVTTNSGKGFCTWRDSLFVSHGLDLRKYVSGGTATITEVGLNNNDGIPAEYAGEIVAVIPGYNSLYALVDSSQTTGTGTSTVMAWDESGWQCVYDAGSTDGAMNCGTVSDDTSYRLWFDHNGTIYYIPLQTGLKNSRLISTTTYDSAGFLVTPWFDGGTKVYPKIIKNISMFCKRLTADETVVIKYRINKSTTAIASTWTTLATLNADDNSNTEWLFASGAGVEFYDIQFRFDLARGSTTTNTPDIQAITIAYRINTEPVWAWSFTVNTAHGYAGITERGLVSALETAGNTNTLLPFIWRDTTYYVSLESFRTLGETGVSYDGRYALQLVEI